MLSLIATNFPLGRAHQELAGLDPTHALRDHPLAIMPGDLELAPSPIRIRPVIAHPLGLNTRFPKRALSILLSMDL